MKHLTRALVAFIAVAGWVQAAYWRERSDWASPADVDRMLADAFTEALEEPDPVLDCHEDAPAVGSYTSAHVVRAAEPPHHVHPWYAVAATTRFDVDEQTGLRLIDTHDGWFVSKQAAHAGIIDWATPPMPRVEGDEF